MFTEPRCNSQQLMTNECTRKEHRAEMNHMSTDNNYIMFKEFFKIKVSQMRQFLLHITVN